MRRNAVERSTSREHRLFKGSAREFLSQNYYHRYLMLVNYRLYYCELCAHVYGIKLTQYSANDIETYSACIESVWMTGAKRFVSRDVRLKRKRIVHI